jgi:hypothetical protein
MYLPGLHLTGCTKHNLSLVCPFSAVISASSPSCLRYPLDRRPKSTVLKVHFDTDELEQKLSAHLDMHRGIRPDSGAHGLAGE